LDVREGSVYLLLDDAEKKGSVTEVRDFMSKIAQLPEPRDVFLHEGAARVWFLEEDVENALDVLRKSEDVRRVEMINLKEFGCAKSLPASTDDAVASRVNVSLVGQSEEELKFDALRSFFTFSGSRVRAQWEKIAQKREGILEYSNTNGMNNALKLAGFFFGDFRIRVVQVEDKEDESKKGKGKGKGSDPNYTAGGVYYNPPLMTPNNYMHLGEAPRRPAAFDASQRINVPFTGMRTEAPRRPPDPMMSPAPLLPSFGAPQCLFPPRRPPGPDIPPSDYGNNSACFISPGDYPPLVFDGGAGMINSRHSVEDEAAFGSAWAVADERVHRECR